MAEQTKNSNWHIQKLIRNANISFNGHQRPVEFIETLEELRDCHELKDDNLIKVLPSILRDQASLWYRINKEKWLNWEDFVADFKKYYYPRNFKDNLEEEILKRKQRYYEKFTTYLIDIQTMMRRYGKYKQEEKLERIYKNMDIGYKHYIKRMDFTTIDELIELAEQFEELKDEYEERNKQTYNRQSRDFQDNRREGDNRKGEQSDPRQENKEEKIQSDYNPETSCWKCGKRNHFAKDCQSSQAKFCYECGKRGRFTKFCCKGQTQIGTVETENRNAAADNRIMVKTDIGGNKFNALVDTGAMISLTSKKVYDRYRTLQDTKEEKVKMKVRLADNSYAEVSSRIYMKLKVNEIEITHAFLLMPNLLSDIVLGMDILRRVNYKLDLSENKQKDLQIEMTSRDNQNIKEDKIKKAHDKKDETEIKEENYTENTKQKGPVKSKGNTGKEIGSDKLRERKVFKESSELKKTPATSIKGYQDVQKYKKPIKRYEKDTNCWRCSQRVHPTRACNETGKVGPINCIHPREVKRETQGQGSQTSASEGSLQVKNNIEPRTKKREKEISFKVKQERSEEKENEKVEDIIQVKIKAEQSEITDKMRGKQKQKRFSKDQT